MKFNLRTLTLSIMSALALTAFVPMQAQAEVLIAPTRVVLEDGEKSAELVVVNKGDEAAAFRISVENRRMLTDGTMQEAEAAQPGEQFAKDFVRFTPRRIILQPGERQTVRVSANTAGLEPGEYRSHLRLMSAPLSAGKTLEGATNTSGELAIQLIAIRSITIPIIARVGDLSAEVAFEGAQMIDTAVADETTLIVKMKRSGTSSTYGKLQVFVDGQPEPVYLVNGVAIYTPNKDRDVVLTIPNEVRDILKNKTVRIAYVSADPQNPETYADVKTVLN